MDKNRAKEIRVELAKRQIRWILKNYAYGLTVNLICEKVGICIYSIRYEDIIDALGQMINEGSIVCEKGVWFKLKRRPGFWSGLRKFFCSK